MNLGQQLFILRKQKNDLCLLISRCNHIIYLAKIYQNHIPTCQNNSYSYSTDMGSRVEKLLQQIKDYQNKNDFSLDYIEYAKEICHYLINIFSEIGMSASSELFIENDGKFDFSENLQQSIEVIQGVREILK